jgi:serine/threonine protein kinase
LILFLGVGKIEESMSCYYLAHMICAVHALHKRGFIHRDLKPANFLIDIKGRLKLAGLMS